MTSLSNEPKYSTMYHDLYISESYLGKQWFYRKLRELYKTITEKETKKYIEHMYGDKLKIKKSGTFKGMDKGLLFFVLVHREKMEYIKNGWFMGGRKGKCPIKPDEYYLYDERINTWDNLPDKPKGGYVVEKPNQSIKIQESKIETSSDVSNTLKISSVPGSSEEVESDASEETESDIDAEEAENNIFNANIEAIDESTKGCKFDQKSTDEFESDIQLVIAVKKNSDQNILNVNVLGELKSKDIIEKCFDYKNGEIAVVFNDRFIDADYDACKEMRELEQFIDSVMVGQYYFWYNFYSQDFAEEVAKILKNKVLRIFPFDKYYKNTTDSWIQCPKSDVFNLFDETVKSIYHNLCTKIKDKRLNNVFELKYKKWIGKLIHKNIILDSVMLLIFNDHYPKLEELKFRGNRYGLKRATKKIPKSSMIIKPDYFDIFFKECLEFNEGTAIFCGDIFNVYKSWSIRHGYVDGMVVATLGKILKSKGFPSKRTNRGVLYLNIKFKIKNVYY